MYNTVIAPVVALIALVVGGVFHINIDEGVQNTIVQGLALLLTAGIALYGIVKNHKKETP